MFTGIEVMLAAGSLACGIAAAGGLYHAVFVRGGRRVRGR